METVYERADYPKSKFQALFKNDTLAMLGYGTQVGSVAGPDTARLAALP